MDIKPTNTAPDYDQAIVRINQLLDKNPEPNSGDDNELEVLSTLVEVYEDEHYPILSPDEEQGTHREVSKYTSIKRMCCSRFLRG